MTETLIRELEKNIRENNGFKSEKDKKEFKEIMNSYFKTKLALLNMIKDYSLDKYI